jgi:uncharacterized pyridoxal phosphate-containing UPF0001 family protein
MNDLIDEPFFLSNLAMIRERIASACASCGRSSSEIRLLPITKTFPLGAAEYALRSGYPAVGENRVREALDKMDGAPPDLQWELVGHLQSNKAKLAAGRFDRIQSVDSVKLLRRLNVAMESREGSQRILLQVNAGEDPAKFGVCPEAAEALLEEGLSLPSIKIEGFMTNPPMFVKRCSGNLPSGGMTEYRFFDPLRIGEVLKRTRHPSFCVNWAGRMDP